jgi:hypothetical protein
MVTGSTENNGIFRVTVECLLSSGIKTHGRRLFSFIDLFPPYFIFLYEQGQIRSLSGLQTSKLN